MFKLFKINILLSVNFTLVIDNLNFIKKNAL